MIPNRRLRAAAFFVPLALASACAPRTAPTPAAPASAGVPSTAGPARAAPALPEPPAFASAVERGTRTREGRPGDAYWQQRVSYAIEAELDPASATLRGTERIVYHNRAPDPLTHVVLNLYQNVFSEGVPRNRYSPVTGGIELDRVAVAGQRLDEVGWPARDAPGWAVRGTIGRVSLPRALASGDSVVLEIDWHFRVPPEGTYRTAWQDALGGRAFVVAQWYPQVATYDDLRGWDETPYLGDGEFYLEYGDFDVAITVPAGWIVGATGDLVNPEAVLTDEAAGRLRLAMESDSVIGIVTETDLARDAATRSVDGTLTWRFSARDVRDFAFATSDRYVWDVATAVLPSTDGEARRVPIHALYRPGAPHWDRAAEFGRDAIGFLSDALVPYPYPKATIAEGSVGGMEYPQMMFIGKPQQPEALYGVIAHEAVHFWFPMLVGSDEASYAWMDEGMASYYESAASGAFFGTEDPHAGDRRSYLAVAGSEAEVPLMRHTDLVTPYGARGVAAYTKPAVLYRALREVVGPDRYDTALREYIRDWSYRHPAPSDFFHAMERAAGRDLDWFFQPWWFGTGTLDQAIASVEPTATGVRVTLRDVGDVAMPVLLVATTEAGDRVRVEMPVERWGPDGVVTIPVEAGSPIRRVEIDPDQVFPDVDRENNVWPAG